MLSRASPAVGQQQAASRPARLPAVVCRASAQPNGQVGPRGTQRDLQATPAALQQAH